MKDAEKYVWDHPLLALALLALLGIWRLWEGWSTLKWLFGRPEKKAERRK